MILKNHVEVKKFVLAPPMRHSFFKNIYSEE